jgi:hypothetical protein
MNYLPPLEFRFNWLDGGSPAAETGDPVFTWVNRTGCPVVFERFEIVNGTTAGTTTAGVVTLATPNADYAATMPGTTTITALGVGWVDAFCEDVIDRDEALTVTITTAPTAAKEASGRITLRPL